MNAKDEMPPMTEEGNRLLDDVVGAIMTLCQTEELTACCIMRKYAAHRIKRHTEEMIGQIESRMRQMREELDTLRRK